VKNRLQIDETLRVDNVNHDKKTDFVSFTVRIGNTSTLLKAKRSEGWLDAIMNFKF
jgi:phage terminase large subunit-like protein